MHCLLTIILSQQGCSRKGAAHFLLFQSNGILWNTQGPEKQPTYSRTLPLTKEKYVGEVQLTLGYMRNCYPPGQKGNKGIFVPAYTLTFIVPSATKGNQSKNSPNFILQYLENKQHHLKVQTKRFHLNGRFVHRLKSQYYLIGVSNIIFTLAVKRLEI